MGLHELVTRVMPQVIADLQYAAGALRRAHQRAGIGGVECERFLDEHVQSGGECTRGMLAMQAVRCRDDHGVAQPEQLVDRDDLYACRNAKGPRACGRRGEVSRADRRELDLSG